MDIQDIIKELEAKTTYTITVERQDNEWQLTIRDTNDQSHNPKPSAFQKSFQVFQDLRNYLSRLLVLYTISAMKEV